MTPIERPGSLTGGGSRRDSRLAWRALAFAALAVLGGCASFGPDKVPSDRFDYNEAIAQSTKEQLLLNLLRLRYLETPVFLSVSSVLTQYTYEGGLDVVGTRGFGSASDRLTGAANLGYLERPTITYVPIVGQEFARRLIAPVPTQLFFAAGQAGWPVDLLMEIGLQRIGAVQNMSFGAVPAPGDIDRERQFAEDLRKLERFSRVVRMILDLAGSLEVQSGEGEEAGDDFLVFDEEATGETRVEIEALKRELGLDPARHVFRITDRLTRTDADEITIQPRSLMAMMSFLSRGVEIPAEHREEGRVVPMEMSTGAGVEPPPVPFRIRSGKEPPESAFSAVRYLDHWFYIDNADIRSKRALRLISLLFRLQAPEAKAAAPVLTLPTGP